MLGVENWLLFLSSRLPPLLSGSQPAVDKQLLGTCHVQSVCRGPGYGLAPLGACGLVGRKVCLRKNKCVRMPVGT